MFAMRWMHLPGSGCLFCYVEASVLGPNSQGSGFELAFKSIAVEMQQYFQSVGGASSIILEEECDIGSVCKDVMLSTGEHAPFYISFLHWKTGCLSRFRDSSHEFVGRQQHR